MTSRRQFFKTHLAGLCTLGLNGWTFMPEAVSAAQNSRALTVDSIDRLTVRVPYREVPQRSMDRELPHWRYSEFVQVKLESGVIGYGETLLYYTWGVSDDADVQRVHGENASQLMWDDSLGAGLQMALFDAVGKSLGMPVHRLFGLKVHDTTPLSWWNIDTPAVDMASECQTALKAGYLSYKTKGRPWFDVWEQVELSVRNLPEEFKIDMDFNSTLRDARRAIPICQDLDKYPQIDIYESPIPQGDVAGNVAIRRATRANIALHYGTPSPGVVLREGVCDGFVVGGGASSVMAQGRFCGQVKMPFWLQLVGTGLTAAYSLHFGAVLRQAIWPAVNCHQLYVDDLLNRPLRVNNGHASVPNEPGIGYEPNIEALRKYQVTTPATRPEPKRLLEISFQDGRKLFLASNGRVNFLLTQGNAGTIPFYEKGVTTRLVPNDGSRRWKRLYKESQSAPVSE